LVWQRKEKEPVSKLFQKLQIRLVASKRNNSAYEEDKAYLPEDYDPVWEDE